MSVCALSLPTRASVQFYLPLPVICAALILLSSPYRSVPTILVSATKVQSFPTCDIVIAGGSLASLAAAMTAANTSHHLNVCLLDITDWPGGQLTASAVPAVDFGPANKDPRNLPRSFVDMLWSLFPGEENVGNCWVSTKCFRPSIVLDSWVFPMLGKLPNLQVFLNTVVTSSALDNLGRVVEISALQRTPKRGVRAWDHLLSEQLHQWYSMPEHSLFDYTPLSFMSFKVAIDATEFGDLLVTSGVRWAQGFETPTEMSTSYYTLCGQGVTIPFFMEFLHKEAPRPDPVPKGSGEGLPFTLRNDTFPHVWSYRRSLARPESTFYTAMAGEVSNQNWGGGNDLDNAYVLESWPQATPVVPWYGGINISALRMAEQRAYGYYHFYKNSSGPKICDYLIMNGTYAGTGHGLAKMPYLRDTRRSAAGLDGFRLCYAHLATNQSDCGAAFAGDTLRDREEDRESKHTQSSSLKSAGGSGTASTPSNAPSSRQFLSVGLTPLPTTPSHSSSLPERTPSTSYRFADTIGIGHYFYADIHLMAAQSCPYPSYLVNASGRPVLPYYLPFRALTVQESPNLLVAGKTMSQVSVHF